MKSQSKKLDTLLTHAGIDPEQNFGIVNPPVYHASTVLFPTLDALENPGPDTGRSVRYGRHGVPTTFALQEAVAAAEGGYQAVALPSGVAAATAAILAFVKAGDHVLIPDHAYGPTRHFAADTLKRFGIAATFYDPMIGTGGIGAGIEALIQDNTRVLFMESPGSLTFEVQDVPALVAVAKAHGLTTILDNTWASPVFFHPLKFGVDVSVVAGTKYIGGHSDAMMGFAICTEASIRPVRRAVADLGYSVGPDNCYLVLRGLRTAGVRMRAHEAQGMALARFLAARPEIERVLHPAFPGHPGHEFWKRDFTGASGLFSVVLKECPRKALAAMLDGMELFGMGYSWGGFESLIVPYDPAKLRSATAWRAPGPLLRIHAGLEDLDDLKDDLARGFERMNAAR